MIVTPVGFSTAIAAASAGDVISLSAGDYAGTLVRNLTFDPPVVLDCSAATLTGWKLRFVKGLTFRDANFRTLGTGDALRAEDCERLAFEGGTATGPEVAGEGVLGVRADGRGLVFTRCQGVKITSCAFSGLAVGVAFSLTQDFAVTDSSFDRMRSDGIVVGNSQRGALLRNVHQGSTPLGSEHPDAVQLLSKDTYPVTADIEISDCQISGRTQGVCGFGVRFERITIARNWLWTTYAQGIALYGVNRAVVTDNRVRCFAGGAGRPTINLRGENIVRKGNVIEGAFGRPAVVD